MMDLPEFIFVFGVVLILAILGAGVLGWLVWKVIDILTNGDDNV